MNSTFSIKKISGIMEEIKKNHIIDSYLMLEQSLSSSYPGGKAAYFKKKIFELKEQTSKESFIGYAWVCNGCVFAIDADWLHRSMVHFYNKGTEKTAWEALELFLRKYFQLSDYEKIFKEIEQVSYIPENGYEKKYPDKYYAWYHRILIAKGKANQFIPGAKQEIIDYGKNMYKTKSGFYQAFMDFDLTKRQSFITSLTPKDRKKWKKIIIDISNNDSDVISFLKEFPN